MYKATKNAFCWTLECNYNMSKINNILEAARKEEEGKLNETELNTKVIINPKASAQKEAK